MATTPFKRTNNPDDVIKSSESLESKYWKILKFGSVQNFESPVVTIAHVNAQYVVGTGHRLHLYKTRSDKLIRSFGRFRSNLRCCSFRSDGELLAAADDDGVVRVFNMSQLHMKASLRLFRGHQGAVSTVRFTSEGTQLVSGSHDGTVRLWDLPTQTCRGVLSVRADGSASRSGEQVRALDVSHRSPSLVLAGAFDGFLRLYDVRRRPNAGPVVCVQHSAPLSAVALSPSDSLMVGAGGRQVGVWALHGGDSHDRVAALDSHHKTVTSLTFGREGSRLLSAGLDGLVKVHHLSTYEEVHHWEITSRIISMSLADNDASLVLGGDDGLLHTRRPRLPEEQPDEAEETTEERQTTFATASKEDPLPSALLDRAIVEELKSKELLPLDPPPNASQRQKREHRAKAMQQRAQLNKFGEQPGAIVHPSVFVEAQNYAKQDRHLMRFQHTQALLTALRPGVRLQHPERTLAVMQELIRRRALKTAIAGQESKTGLSALLFFIRRYIWRPTYSATLQYAVQCILEVYRNDSRSPLRNDPLKSHIMALEKVIMDELQFISAAQMFKSLAEAVTEEEGEEKEEVTEMQVDAT